MAKITKRNLDSAKRAPLRQKSYEAPAIRRRNRQVPKEYQSFQKAPKSRGSCLWFLFLLFLATLAGFWYWNKQTNPVTENSLEFAVSGPEQIVSGDQAVYRIRYKNIDLVPLQQMELDVRWPSGFYFDEASIEPHDSNATTWLLPDLAPGSEVELEIKGQLVGQKDEEMSALFTLGYQPENFHSDFKSRATVATKISDSRLDVSIEGVEKTLVATPQDFTIVFKNLTDESITDLYADILYPDDWAAADNQATAESNDDNTANDFVPEENYLKFDLEPQEEKTLLISGMFPIDSRVDQLLVVEVGNMVDDNFRRLSRVEKTISVVNPKFDIKFEINGKIGSQTVNWGDVLRYQLELKNMSDAEITDVKVSALVDSEVIDWNSLDTVGSYEDGKISWSKDEDSSLAAWPAGETKTFTWQVKVTDDPVPDRAIENIIKLTVDGLPDWEQVTSPVILTVGESLAFNNGIYWDLGGRRVGSGLLPPQVGEETEYLVIWSLPEATGNFDSVTVDTSLPPDVDFISETDIQAGELEFDLEARSLVWSIDDFDNLILPTTASFIIRLTPDEASRGQAVTLLNPTTVTAQGLEEVIVRSRLLKTSDVMANTSEPIGIVQ